MNIYVANLNFDIQSEELKEVFTPYGEVTSANVITDKVTGRSRGFGFVEMSDDTAAKTAIAELDGSDFGGRAIKVNEAKPREDRGGSGGGGRSSGGGGGYRGGSCGGGNFNKASSYNQNRY
jgi:RNA recognition motif-containing protein